MAKNTLGLDRFQPKTSSSGAGKRRRRWLRRGLITLAILFALYNILCLLVIPPLARWIAQKKLTEKLHRKVEIKSVRINPYVLSVRVRGFRINRKDGQGTLAAFDEFYANGQLRSLFHMGPVLREVTLINPSVSLERRKDGTLNIADLLKTEEPASPPQEDESEPPHFLIERFRIVNGQFRLEDQVVGTTHTIENLNISVPLVSNMEDFIEQAVEPTVEAVVNASPLHVDGGTKPFTEAMDTSMQLSFERIDLPFYFKYIPLKTHFRPLAGELSIRLRGDFQRDAKAGERMTVSGNVELTGLDLVDAQEKPLLKLPQLKVTLSPSNVLAKDIQIAEIYLREPEIHGARDASGTLNLLSLVELPTEPEPAADSSPASITIEKLIVEGGRTTFSDLSGTQPFEISLSPINIKVANFSTVPAKTANCDVSIHIGEGEDFNVSGSVCLNPLQADLGVALTGLELARFQGYIPTDLNIAVAEGRFGTTGRVHVATAPGEPPKASCQGAVTLDSLLVTDRKGNGTFLKFAAFKIKGLDLNASPLSVVIDEVSLNEFASDMRVEKNGTLNLSQIVARSTTETSPVTPPETELAVATPSKPPLEIRVKRLQLQKGRIGVTDLSVTPRYESSVSDMNLTADGFVLGGAQPVTLKFDAVLDNYAAFFAKGMLKPDPVDPFVDMTCELTNLSMPRLSPYSRQFIGYDINKGKFNLAFSFLLSDNELQVDPNIFLDQFTLGEKVDKEKMKGMPIGLAIAILKNSKGEIKLHVPITGRLDDPTFHLKDVIIQFFLGLLKKAATSPFALLASILPGGEDLSYVEFVPGSATPTPAGRETLDTLVTALYERPSLKLVIDAYADPSTDGEAIRHVKLIERLVAQKLALAPMASQPSEGQEAEEVRPDEYAALLRAAFLADGISRLLGASSRRGGVSTDEIEALMLARFTPTEERLRALTKERAETIYAALIASGKIDSSRISIGTPETLAPKSRKGVKACRVEFQLQATAP